MRKNDQTHRSWSCGPDKIEYTKKLAFISVALACPRNIDAFNYCCVLHDDCYLKKVGQEYCDQLFCDCMVRANCSRTFAAEFCFAVKTFGDIAYEEDWLKLILNYGLKKLKVGSNFLIENVKAILHL